MAERGTPKKRETGDARRGKGRERILAEAVELFSWSGFDGVSTTEIAAAAGVSQSVVIYHFGSKEQLWRAALSDLFTRFRAKYAGVTGTLKDLDVVSRLRIRLRLLVDVASSFPELSRLMLREGSQGGPRMEWLYDELIAPTYSDYMALLAEGIEEGKLKRYPLEMLLMMTHSAAVMLYNLQPLSERLMGRSVHDPEIVATQADMVVDLVLNGLLTQPART